MSNSRLINAIQTNDALTANGAVTHSTSSSDIVDFFFLISSMRGKDASEKIELFERAINQDFLAALRILFYSRDCRGGQGERQTFRELYNALYKVSKKVFMKNLANIPAYGRWDDLISLLTIKDEEVKNYIISLIAAGLNSKEHVGLVAKWLPREKSKNGNLAKLIANKLHLTLKEYRILCRENSNTVEQLMSQKRFDHIKYATVPSKAMLKYNKAFLKKDKDRFSKFIEDVAAGKTKVNASTLNPCDIIRKIDMSGHMTKDEILAIDNQWNALPNYLKDSNKNILVVCDTSGSMTCGSNKNMTPLEVSTSLAIYLAERMNGLFKNHWINFSTTPTLIRLNGNNIYEKYYNMDRDNWCQSTDLQAVFNLILNKALHNNLKQDEMPTDILIISDMEFNHCCSHTNYDLIRAKYLAAGYNLPNITFWNVNGRMGNVPVKFDTTGTALVSGYSPSIVKYLIGGKDFSPETIVYDIVNSGRYDLITL